MNEDLQRRRDKDFNFMVLCASKGNMGMYHLLRDRSLDTVNDEIAAGEKEYQSWLVVLCHPPAPDGVKAPAVIDGRTEEQWCQEACRIGAYDYIEAPEGAKRRIRVFSGERTPERVAVTINGLKAQAERYDRTHGVLAETPKSDADYDLIGESGLLRTAGEGEVPRGVAGADRGQQP